MKWSGRVDLNHRPPGPEESGVNNLSAAPGVACGTFQPLTLPLNWTEDGLNSIRVQQLSCVQIEGLQPTEFIGARVPNRAHTRRLEDSRGASASRAGVLHILWQMHRAGR